MEMILGGGGGKKQNEEEQKGLIHFPEKLLGFYEQIK
jgi:hypothetical protein